MSRFLRLCIKSILPGILAWAFYSYVQGQYGATNDTWNKLLAIESDSISAQEKIQQVLKLRKECEDRKQVTDSVYARILHRIGALEYQANNEVATKNGIANTVAALRINSSGKKGAAPAFCVNSYTNLAKFYRSLQMYDIASRYFDSALLLKKRYEVSLPELNLLSEKAQMLFMTGDYQKAIDELTVCIVKAKEKKDSAMLQTLYNQRSQSFAYQQQAEEALGDVESALRLSDFGIAADVTNSLIIKAKIVAKRKDFLTALNLFKEAIKQRLQTSDDSQIADDYTDLGNFYINDLHNYIEAKSCYEATVFHAKKANDFERLSKGHINLELYYFRQNKYKEAEYYCTAALNDITGSPGSSITNNPSVAQLGSVGNKELVLVILSNKTELLLRQFMKTKNAGYMSACLRTIRLTDSLITKMRHEQLGEKSKLYWRMKTREFFTYTMEACYLSGDAALAYYFMEKSRSVLLQDKLNELGASAHLPDTEAAKERALQVDAVVEQQKLNSLPGGDPRYEVQHAKLSEAKDQLEHYIKSLENKYPSYYQYKYADEVPALKVLQKKLLENKRAFIHYFIDDTVAYVLSITPDTAKLMMLPKENFSSRMLTDFMQVCSDRQSLNNRYDSFASLSYQLYLRLFQPLAISAGRVVVCADQYLIPFEALCSDQQGHHFLVENYAFSYVYSAGYLLSKSETSAAKGDFIGFAPVSFSSYKNVADLKQSAAELKQSAKYYSNTTTLVNDRSSRRNFIQSVPDYAVVNVFSHARADTSGSEPVLFMYDSIISLSELQLLHNPATRLAVLSGCQTNVGKIAKGEGILSLARGFAAAGIPAVAATLWKADEQTIYEISGMFHRYLSQGLRKDDALQKAKSDFIKSGGSAKRLPYYWANMVLAGNAEPLQFSHNNYNAWRIAAVVFLAITAWLIIWFNKIRASKK